MDAFAHLSDIKIPESHLLVDITYIHYNKKKSFLLSDFQEKSIKLYYKMFFILSENHIK